METEDLKQRLKALFAEEAQERARALERDLLSLEKSGAADRRELLKSLFRDAHSLKGAAGLVEVRVIESACHWMEELFAAARDGRLDLDQTAIELLLAVTDAMAESGRRLSDGNGEPGSLSDLIPKLAAILTRNGPVSPAASEENDLPASPSGNQMGQSGPELPFSSYSEGGLVRVPARRLDTLLSQTGELLAVRYRGQTRMDEITALRDLSRRLQATSKTQKLRKDHAASSSHTFSGVENLPEDGDLFLRLKGGLQQLGTALAEDYRMINKAAAALDGQLRRARTQPFSQACEGLDRVVRDLGRGSGKSVRLVIVGGDVELDRSILERLRDVLRHLVRNAVDHGLEPVEERRAAGKAEIGQITIAAALRGDRVQISVADDGRGLDLEAINKRAQDLGIAAEAEGERESIRYIFLPSFSTSPNVTQVSGRGVGLDVVKTTIEDMRGSIDISHVPGQGTTFTLISPLTLSKIRALLLKAGGQVFAVDTTGVDRLIRISKEDIHSVEGQPAILTSNGPIAVLELSDWLGLPSRGHRNLGKFPAIILSVAGRETAVIAEEVLAEQELVVRGLGPRLSGIRRYSGGTILSDGRVALVLNAAALAETAVDPRRQGELASFREEARPAMRRRVLVADDSVTIRTLQKSILEAAGYEVTVASDGAEAWQILQRQGADIVVSDVEMPRMDGFVLTEAIRGSERFKEVPVVLVTARETEQDKARGLQLGADAYLLKSAFDQRQLLETISQLI